MTKRYTFIRIILPIALFALPLLLHANGEPKVNPLNGGPAPDSLAARMGHCNPITIAVADCAAGTIELSAAVSYLFSGLIVPYVGVWNSGETAHKITVVPPGDWSWDASGTGCELYHWDNTYSAPVGFFDDTLEIVGPGGICINGSTATLSVVPSDYPFSAYSWNQETNGDPTYQITAPGVYTLTALDPFGCPFTDQINIPPSIPVPTVSGSPEICIDNGTAVIMVNEPWASYSWSTGDTENPITVTEPGLYKVTITNDWGCTGESFYLVQPSPGIFPALSGPLYICPQGDTALVQVNQIWSSYTWSNGETTNPAPIFEPGAYEVTVTNNIGCTGVGAIAVGSGEIKAVPIALSQPGICIGNPDTLLAIGGFASYQWSNNTIGRTNIVTQPGTYYVTVTNIYGCTGVDSVKVGLKLTPTIGLTSTPLCPGDTSTLTVTGGPFPNYLWSGGLTTNPINVTAGGTYSVTVSGIAFCPTSTSVTIAQLPPPITVIAAPTQLNCLVKQMVLNATASSAAPNFNYLWTTVGGNFVSGQGTLNPTVDAPGTYTLIITNSLTGCTSSASVTVTSDTQTPLAPTGNPNTLTCTILDFNIGPLIPPSDTLLSPVWVANSGGNIVSGADTWNPKVNEPGTYTLTVTNSANGCTATGSVVIPENIALPNSVIAAPTELTCTMNSSELNGSGSSTGPNITYLWTTPNGTITGSTNTVSTTAVSAGTYTLLVTNLINGCTATSSATLTADVNIPKAVAAPPATLTCGVPSITINANGTTPGLNYTWTGPVPGSIIGGQGTLQPIVNAPGTYSLLVFNAVNSCSATLSVLVHQDIITPNANAGQNDTLSCLIPNLNLDGSASSGGPNFSYQWSTSNGKIVSGATGLIPVVDTAGTYVLLVTNNTNGCSSTSSVQILNDASTPVALITSSDILTCSTKQTIINGSQSSQGPTYNYIWSGPGIIAGQGTLQPTVNAPGEYLLSIINTANGCTDTETITVIEDIVTPTAQAGTDDLINCITPTGTIGNPGNPGGSNFTLVWSTLDGNFTSATNGPTATVDSAGTYTLLITNITNGCTDTDEVIVLDDFVPPSIDAGPTFELSCTQTTTTLQGTGSSGPNFAYQWTTTDGNILNGASTLLPTVNQNGTYMLVISNTQNGCSSTDQVLITVSADVPTSLIAPPATLTCILTSLNLDANGSSVSPTISYNWVASNGGNLTSGTNTLTPGIDAPGTYTLTTTDIANSCTSTKSITVLENIIPPVVKAVAPNILTCAVTNFPLAASIDSSSSTNLTYAWSTLDGTIVNGANTLTPTISATGTYTLLVTDNINGCTGTDNVVITNDTIAPVALIAQPETLTCTVQQTPVDGTASSPGANFTYAWTTQDGHIVNGANSNKPLVDDPGTYNLLITNLTNGCTETASAVVPEDVVLPTAVAGPTLVLDCDTQTGGLNGSASSQGANFTYLWTTTNGQILSGPTTLAPQIGDPGTYTLTVSNLVNGCVSTSSVITTEDVAPPVFTIDPPQLLTCVTKLTPLDGAGAGFGPNPTYSWTASGGGNITSGANTLHAQADAPGTYTLLITNNQNGCTDSEQVVVSSNTAVPPVSTQPVAPLNCTVLQRTLQATAPPQALLQWTTVDGHIVSGANSANPVVDQPGTYVVLATLPLNGCTAVAQVPLAKEQNVPTGLEFNLDPPLCNGTLGLLTVDQINGGVQPFQYSIDGGTTYFPAQDIDGLKPGTYDLVIRDANGCTITQEVPVPTPPSPAVSLPPSFSIQIGENQELQAIVPPAFPLPLIDQVIWEPTTGLTFEGTTISEMLNPLATPFVTTEYKVTIISKEGCKATSRTIIRVDRDIDIYAPNVIRSEDPDSDNGGFTLFTRKGSVIQILSLQIYDRWGEQLFVNKNFQPDDPRLGWQGDYKGEWVNPGVFVWWAEVELIDGQKILLKGDVTVVR